MSNEIKKYASLENLQTFKTGADGLYATQLVVDNISSNVAYINKTDNESVTDAIMVENTYRLSLTPDMFNGTDSEKIQACFDELVNTGGIIILEREYTLSDNIVISHSSNKNNRIIVRGYGKHAKINFGEFSLVQDAETSADGGILFEDVEFVGTGVMLNAKGLIRTFFSNCTISAFKHIIYNQDGYIQTCHFTNCLIRQTTDVAIKTVASSETTSGNAGCLYDLTITNCLIEWCKGLLDCNSAHGCSISHNCIEGFSGVPIKIRSVSRGFDICGNYFELNDRNGTGVNINLSTLSKEGSLTIQNNYFSNTGTTGVIVTPKRSFLGSIVINGNTIWPSTSILIKIPDDIVEKNNVYAFGNIGETSGDTMMIASLSPENVATVDAVLAAIDQWEGGEY